MPIPQNIQREHVFQAILKIEWEGIPSRKGIRDYALSYEKRLFPMKLVVSWANLFANGYELDPNPNNFNSLMANAYLEKLGFTIIKS